MKILIKLILSTSLSFLIMFKVSAFDHQYKSYNKILSQIYKKQNAQALVNYKLLSKKPAEFNKLLTSISKVTKSEFKAFSKIQQLAFLINSYNIFTIKLILKNLPVKSIKDIGSLFTSAWKKKFFTFLGEKTYLDHIEHDLIRKKFDEPRIHFAVVCASIGCPNIQKEAFISSKLNLQLDNAAKEFINDVNKNSFNKKKQQLSISKIFKWYGDDFKTKYGSYLKFIALHLTDKNALKNKIKKGQYKLKWKDYNWNLNKW